MKFGILVNTDLHLEHLAGLTRAASGQGHEVVIFAMDRGTHLTKHREFVELCRLPRVTISLCRHSAEEHGIDVEGIPKDIVCGSQFNNAAMAHEADRVLVL